MANYALKITDNGDGSWSLTTCMRGPTTTTISGGTDILPATLVAAAGSPTGTTTGYAYTGTLGDALQRAVTQITADRALNPTS